MNVFVCDGNLVNDVQSRVLQSGMSVSTFRIAVDGRSYKNKQGDLVQKTTFLSCDAWGDTGEKIEEYFEKGDRICLVGSLEQDDWKDKDGNNRSTIKMKVDRFEFPRSGKNKQKDESDQVEDKADVVNELETVGVGATPF